MKIWMSLLLIALLVVVLAVWVALPWQGALVLAALLAAWLALTRSGRRAMSVASVGISTLGQRLGSSAFAAGTSAIASSYAGFTDAKRLPERLSTHSPPISIFHPRVSSSAARRTCNPKVSLRFMLSF